MPPAAALDEIDDQSPAQSSSASLDDIDQQTFAHARPGPYQTSLQPSDERQFQSWVKQNKVPWQDSPTADYDMRGYWKAQRSGDANAKQQQSAFDGKMHFPDTYKTPYHKTFSNESMYATSDAPHWDGDRLLDASGKVVADETPKSTSASLDDIDQQQAAPATPPHDFTQEALSGKLAPPAGAPPQKGTDPQGTPAQRISRGQFFTNPRTGQRVATSDIPETEMPMYDPARIFTTGPEQIADATSEIKDNFTQALVPPMGKNGGAVTPEQRAATEQAGRKLAEGTSDLVKGVGDVSMPLVGASAVAAPWKTAAGFGAGFLTSEGAGAVAHGKVSPESEDLIRTLASFIPHAMATVSGLRAGTAEIPGGKVAGATVFDGKAGVAVRSTPKAFEGAVKIGDTRIGARFPRSGQAAPPEPSEAAKALASFEQNSGNPDFQAPPPPPNPPGPENLTPDIVQGISSVVMQAPAQARPGIMTEAHGNMVKWMMNRGTFTGPDHKIYTVDNVGQAKKLASKFINDEVDRVDQAQADAAKQTKVEATTNAPVSGKPPKGKGLTTDTEAVRKVTEEAQIHPEQKPAVMVKKEPPKETAALAKPPEPISPKEAAKIGSEDADSGRKILQPSDDVMQNERLAAHAAPELATKLSHIAAGIEGATFDRLRPQKELERVDEKIEAEKPPETVPDYLAAQIAADSPQAKDSLIHELKKNFKVVNVEDAFLEGRPKLAGYPSANIQVQMENGLTAEVQIVPREVQEIANESHKYYTAGREAEIRGDHVEKDRQYAIATKLHNEAMDKFRERNGLEPKNAHDFSSTQINIDPASELGQAHAKAVAAIPQEHIGKEGVEKEPHVTIRYGLKDDSPEAIGKIREAAAKIAPFEVPIGKTEVFPATEHSSFDHPVIARLETTPELNALRSAVEAAGAFKEDNFPEYKPHVTLGYIKPEFAQQYKGGNQLEGQKVPVDSFVISKRDGTHVEIPLGGEGVEQSSASLDKIDAGDRRVEPRGNERRVEKAERKRVADMLPEERAKLLLTSEAVDLPNKRAFLEAEQDSPAQYVAMSDADGLKALNDRFGYEAGTALLRAKAEALKQAGLDAYHDKGDEFLYRGDSPEQLQRGLDKAREILRNSIIKVETKDGGVLQFKGADFSYGTGKDLAAAETGLKAHKSEREARGERARGELRGITQVGSQDSPQDHGPQAVASPGLFAPEKSPLPPGVPERGEYGDMSPKALTRNPKRFQYKLNINQKGTTGALDGRKWNKALADVVYVWHDPADGKTYVVDGHHRSVRAEETGQTKLHVYHIDVDTADQARAIGALHNIALGRGTAIDAAKFLRDSNLTVEDLEQQGITLTDAMARNGVALSRLDPSIFEKVATGKMTERRGVLIGEATDDAAQQEAIVKFIDKKEAAGKNVTEGMIAELARFVANSGSRTVEQGGLFGANQEIHSLAMEKAEVSSHIRSEIGKERRIFGAVSSEGKANALGQVQGQQIKATENKQIADAAAQAEEVYNKLSSSVGPVNDILDKASRELASNAKDAAGIKQRAYAAVRHEIRKILTRGQGPGPERVQEDRGPRSGDEETPALSVEQSTPTFFSKAEKVAGEKLPNTVAARSVIPTLKNSGVKDDEIRWLGLEDWLAGKEDVSKKDVEDFIRQNNVQVKEVEKSQRQMPEMAWLETKSGYDRPMWVTNVGRAEFSIIQTGDSDTGADEFTLYRNNDYLGHFETLEAAQRDAQHESAGKGRNAPKFSQYQLPGGSNYRELLLRLPQLKVRGAVPARWKVIQPGETGPAGHGTNEYFRVFDSNGDLLSYGSTKTEALNQALEDEKRVSGVAPFNSPHFDESNVLAHIRFNDRISPDGRKTLFIEEVQSDWHQKGRKAGYADPKSGVELEKLGQKRLAAWREALPLVKAADNLGYDSPSQVSGDIASGALSPEHIDETGVPGLRDAAQKYAEAAKQYRSLKQQIETGVPDAPFKNNWHELAMKRMLRYAAENGYDRVGWTTGEQQAARYDLSKQIESVSAEKLGHDETVADHARGKYQIKAYQKGSGATVIDKVVDARELPDIVGKDLAEKIVSDAASSSEEKNYRGVDLKVGGQGMKGFYDKILPDFLNKYGKKWGARVESSHVSTTRDAKQYEIEQGGTGTFFVVRNGVPVEGLRNFRSQNSAEKWIQDHEPINTGVPVHSIDITPSMKHSVLNEGQPLFHLGSDDLSNWAKAAGSRLKIEEMGEQGNMFGGGEKMYRLSTSKQNSVAVTQQQLDALVKSVPAVARKMGIEPSGNQVRFEYTPPAPASLFAQETTPTLVVSKAARDLIHEAGGIARFNGANIAVSNARVLAARLAGEQEPLAEIPADQKQAARDLADAIHKAVEDAGKSGVTLLVEGSPEHVAHEEEFHSKQRLLGEGQIAEHLPAEAIERLLSHPAAKELESSLTAMGYTDKLPAAFKVAEIAAKIATGQHGENDRQAADWFVKYVTELHQYHGEDNVASAFADLYDGARKLYEQAKAANAGTVQRPTRGGEAGIQSTAESLPERATGPPEEGRGDGAQENSLGKKTQTAVEPPAYALSPKKTLTAFYKQDVEPLAKSVAGGLHEIATRGLAWLAPRTRVADNVLDVAMRMKGAREREIFTFQKTTEAIRTMFDKMPEADRVGFIDRIMQGQPQPTPHLQQVQSFLEQIQSRFRAQEKKFRPTLADRPNYFHLQWKVIPGSGGKMGSMGGGNRPLQGNKGFMKQKTIPDLSTGMANGGVPISTNPVDLVEDRVMDSLKFTTARELWEELQNTPYSVDPKGRVLHVAQFFRQGQWKQARELGYEQLNDSIAKVMFPAASGEGFVNTGEYWVEENTAQLLNNFLSQDLIRKYAAGRGIVTIKNGFTAWRLAFSPFHALTESILAVGSEVGRGIEHAWNEGVRHGSIPDVGKGIAIAGKGIGSPVFAAREGGSAVRYVGTPQQFVRTLRGQAFVRKYPGAADLISDLFTGGAKLAMNEDFRLKAVKGFRQAMADDNYLGAVFRAPLAFNQLVQYPLFETYIPRLKVGMFLREYSEALASRDPEIAAGKLTREKLSRDVWNRIDDRFGELNWDNFFWNRTFKTAVQLAFRAFSWTAGNFRFVGAAARGQTREVAESIKFLKDAYSGGNTAQPGTNAIPKIDPMMAKLLGLLLTGVALHTVLQLILTHELPKDHKDLIAPRDGTFDKEGRPNRWSLPIVPFKDAESLQANPSGYAKGKLADIWTTLPEVINNRDFQNHLISHPSDPWWEQMLEKSGHVVGSPIGAQKFFEEKKRGETTATSLMGELGLSRTGKAAAMSPAEKKMREIQQAHFPPETDEELEAREKRQARMQSGNLTPQERKRAIKEGMKNEFERGMEHFTYEQAKEVYDLASPEERSMIGLMLLRKQFNARRTTAGVR